MNKLAIAVLLISICFGALIWFLSPMMTGYSEPWDAKSPYYVVSLFLSGALAGLLVRKRLWLVPLGVILGQLLYIISFLPLGPLFALGIIYGRSEQVGFSCSFLLNAFFILLYLRLIGIVPRSLVGFGGFPVHWPILGAPIPVMGPVVFAPDKNSPAPSE
jgi:hypothetical protein